MVTGKGQRLSAQLNSFRIRQGEVNHDCLAYDYRGGSTYWLPSGLPADADAEGRHQGAEIWNKLADEPEKSVTAPTDCREVDGQAMGAKKVKKISSFTRICIM
jgi:hypothetical protein